jgi:hypothetical protein
MVNERQPGQQVRIVSDRDQQRADLDLPAALSWQEAELVLVIIFIGLVLATIPAALAYRGSVSSALRA